MGTQRSPGVGIDRILDPSIHALDDFDASDGEDAECIGAAPSR